MPFLIPIIISVVVNVVVALVISAIASALNPKPSNGLKSTMQVSLSANDPRRIIFGRAGTAGSLVTFQTWGANNEWIVLLFRVADHKCKGLAPQMNIAGTLTAGSALMTSVTSTAGLEVGMPVGGTTAGWLSPGTFIEAIPAAGQVLLSQEALASVSSVVFVCNAGAYWSGNPIVLGVSNSVPRFFANGRNNCFINFYGGDWNQAVDGSMLANSNGRWTTDSRGRGVAYVEIIAYADATAFPNGISELFQFTYVVDGISLYDRRLDSSVGGSGTQRWDDQSTWTLNSNSAVVAENLLRGIRVEDTTGTIGSRSMDTYFGLALTDADLPFAENVSAMNHCDESVALLAGGTELRYACNGVITCDPSQTFETVFGDVLITMAGKLLQAPARFILLPGVAQTSVRTFQDSDFRLDGPSRYTNDTDLDTIANAIVGQFADPASMYTAQPLPPRTSPVDAATDGGYKSTQVDLSYVTSETQGQRVQEIFRRRQRLQATAQKALAPENLDLEAGDWITWVSARYGWTKIMEILQRDGRATGQEDDQMMIVLDLQETDAGVYDWTPSVDELSRFAPAILPSADTTAVPVTSLTATVATITSSTEIAPALAVTRDAVTDPTVVAVIYQYNVHGLPAGAAQVLSQTFAVYPATETGTESATLTLGIVGGYQYDVQAAYVRQPPQPLDWSAVVTTSTATGANASFVQSGDPTGIQNGVSGTYVVPDGATWFNSSTGVDYRRSGGAWVAVNQTAATGSPSGTVLYSNQTPGAWSFTVPATAPATLDVETWGDGGGGQIGSPDDAGFGGDSGAYSKSTITSVPGTTALSGTIGPGGVGSAEYFLPSLSYQAATAGTGTTASCASPSLAMSAGGGGVGGASAASASGGGTNTAGNVGTTGHGAGAPNGGGNTGGATGVNGSAPGGGGGPGSHGPGGATGIHSGNGAPGMVKISVH